MLILSCPAEDVGDANVGILTSVGKADLTVHRCKNELVLP
jgi:hypothetical protein